MVRVLCDAGADLNIRNARGETSLLLAIRLRNSDIVRALCAAGADLDIKDANDETPLAMAVRLDNQEIINFLREERLKRSAPKQ